MTGEKWDPQTTKKDTPRPETDIPRLDVGTVMSVGGVSGHTVRVRVDSLTEDGTIGGSSYVAPVTVDVPGDINVPPEGSQVVVANLRGRRPVILGTLYKAGEEVPSYKAGDRILSHAPEYVAVEFTEDGDYELTVDQPPEDEETTITVGRDGSISIDNTEATIDVAGGGDITVDNGDGATVDMSGSTVTINGGSQGAIYDVTTTKDGDGHVTDISLNRRPNILI